MAYTSTDRAAVGRREDGLWGALAARFAWYRNYRRTLDELAMLSDRDLADLGLHRSLIADVAREAADRA